MINHMVYNSQKIYNLDIKFSPKKGFTGNRRSVILKGQKKFVIKNKFTKDSKE